jgi:3-phosphoshikimate 1-carboxyvinyltransferase
MGVSMAGPRMGRLRIEGRGPSALEAPTQPLDMGNSGTAMRLMAGILAGMPFPTELTGDASLSRRPMARVIDPLRQMGADIQCGADATPPLRIRPVARLRGIEYELPVASAQVKSALLLAGLFADGTTTVVEPMPTRDHSERMLAAFGCPVAIAGPRRSVTGPAVLQGTPVQVPADLSSAAFFLVAASIGPGSEVVLENVGINPTRTGVIEILAMMGADITATERHETAGEPVADLCVRYAPLRGVRIPENLVPLAIDEFPAIAIAAACAEGETVVTGAGELRVKESDRIAAIVAGLVALGVEARELEDGFVVRGGGLAGGTVDSRADHRIAMAFAVAGLRASAAVRIAGCDNVATSFPGFAPLARNAGLAIVELP